MCENVVFVAKLWKLFSIRFFTFVLMCYPNFVSCFITEKNAEDISNSRDPAILEYLLTGLTELFLICLTATATRHLSHSQPILVKFARIFYLLLIILKKIDDRSFLVQCFCFRYPFGKLKSSDLESIQFRCKIKL